MAHSAAVLYVIFALGVWFLAMHLPSLIVIFFTHKNYSILLSADYWIVSLASSLPSIIGLVLFIALYPLFKAPGEGAMAGLWFLFVGALMMVIGSARFAYRYPATGDALFWDAFKFGCWPYLIMIGIYCLLLPFILYVNLKNNP